MKPITEALAESLLGRPSNNERGAFDRRPTESPASPGEVDDVAEALACAAADALAPLFPPRPLRERLMATLAGVDRFAPFMDDLAQLFDLPEATLRALLARADGTAAGWETSLAGVALAGTELFHFPVGPRAGVAGAAGGVLRVRAGARFPMHSHGGDEVTYVLEGICRTGGRAYGPGASIVADAGSDHDFSAGAERDLLIMVLHHGIAFAGGDLFVGPGGS